MLVETEFRNSYVKAVNTEIPDPCGVFRSLQFLCTSGQRNVGQLGMHVFPEEYLRRDLAVHKTVEDNSKKCRIGQKFLF